MRSPAIALLGAFLLGLVASEVARFPSPLAFAGAAVFLLGAAVLAARQRLYVASGLVLAGFVALGVAASRARDERSAERTLLSLYRDAGEKSFVHPALVAGRLRREPELGLESALLTLDAESIELGREKVPARGGVRVGVRGDERARLRELATGDEIRVWGRLDEPALFRNPGGFDGSRFRERERVDLALSVKSALLVDVEERGSLAESFLSRARAGAIRRIESAFGARSDDASLGIVVALVTGDRSRLAPGIQDTYRDAGVFHVMAISGAHVAIVILAVYFTLRRAGWDEATTLVVLLFLLPLYAGFCGSGPPVVRAVVVAMVVVGARLSSLDRPRGNALALAALLLLAWEPAWVFDAGFQLSFAAMAAILWLSEPLALALRRLGPLAGPIAVSIAAQAGVLPVTAWHFHSLTPVAPFASVVAIPLAGIVVILGLALVVVSGVPLAAPLVSGVTRLAVWLLTGTARISAGIPGASFAIPRPSLLWVLVYLATLVAIRHGRRWHRAAGGLVLVSLLFVPFGERRLPTGELGLTALDVGHGDALVVSLPGGERILVDGGGLPGSSFDVGERVVLPYLLDHGGRRLDAVVTTHSDFDHLGGLFAVVDSMRVGEIWEGPSPEERPAYEAFRARAARRGIPFRRLRAGERFELGGVQFEVLAAGGVSGRPPPAEENERSLVLRLIYGKSRVLLTGDSGRTLEEALVSAPGDRLSADVLKVGHHGSRSSTSPALLEAVRPRLAIVSARRSASRALPAPRVLHRLRSYGVDYLRTDEDGAITVRLDAAGNLEVQTVREWEEKTRR